MTTMPTLKGRWQMRLLVLLPVGLVLSIVFGVLDHTLSHLLVLGYIMLFGLAWDVLYQTLLHLRWDQDWPTLLQVIAGVLEGAAVWVLIDILKWPGSLHPVQYVLFYSCLWVIVFIIGQGVLRVLMPFGRYCGGELR